MNKINLAVDFQELTCEEAAAIQGGVIRVAKGREPIGLDQFSKRIRHDRRNVGNFWNDKISYIVVYTGKWRFYENDNYRGRSITLGRGAHDLSKFKGGRFNNVITSFKEIG